MFNYCPKCCSKKIDFIDQRYFKCSGCQFIYFHNVATATAAIIVYSNQILMTYRAKDPEKGKLDLPGGFANPNETLEQCISREAYEELGIRISDWQYFCSLPNSYTFENITYNTQDCVFITHLNGKPQITAEQNELADYKWLNINSVDTSQLAFNSLRTAVDRFIQSNK